MFTEQRTNATANRITVTALALVMATAMAGCASKDRMTTGSVSRSTPGAATNVASMTEPQLRSAADSLGRAYTKNTKDKATALRYASVLQMTGRADQSLAVMRKLAIDHPQDRQVLAAYGKALAAAGELQPALDAVRRAQTPEYPDWRLQSAEGAILDQLGQKDAARALYTRALNLQPNEPSILSNMGMSYLLEGNLKSAEHYMRQAAQSPGADSRVRQNLALVVGLQGRFGEAEQLARHELSPDQAEANVAYLRAMLSQQNAWSQLSDKKKKRN
ncbi:tetratricopeptide repeat protein [Nitratireductor aquimarinus]|uniref:Tetratricopeptide repeat protein n=1 Tax=Nitratireductor aquimarinus TaxID=889300 RepID=A0ABU4ALQ7_9HYPH|nr:tetratricopeptide repeat protein [Nitratireductor aquimarinus]MDV6227187.1 tetratricopeptide repeat protein [Nitratireductor aquimarinus]